MKDILVTGGLGYIGSHTVVQLIEKNYNVTIVDNLSNSKIFILDNIEKITGKRPHYFNIDLTDYNKINSCFSNNKFDGVIHFAALKSVSESINHPDKYYHNNLNSLLNLLRCMKESDIKNIIFSSSCTVYGQPDKLPVSEKSPFKEAESPYARTKQMSENIIEDFTNSISYLSAISLRYFNPVGAHHSGLIGELPLGTPDNLVPYITQTAAGIRQELKIFGDDYNTHDGTAIRDYIHVEDLAEAHITALQRMIENKMKSKYEYYNIGTGVGYSVLDVVKSFENVNKLKLNYSFSERRSGDIEKMFSDCTISNKKLGWNSKNGLDEMMSSAWKWEKNISKFLKG